MTPQPLNPYFAEDIKRSFARQAIMRLIGAELGRLEPGKVEIALPYRTELTQQNGYLHAGVVTTIADSACGYAAYSLMPADSEVLSVEFKINLLRPAKGDKFLALAEVIKPGKTLTVVKADVFYLAYPEKPRFWWLLCWERCFASETPRRRTPKYLSICLLHYIGDAFTRKPWELKDGV